VPISLVRRSPIMTFPTAEASPTVPSGGLNAGAAVGYTASTHSLADLDQAMASCEVFGGTRETVDPIDAVRWS